MVTCRLRFIKEFMKSMRERERFHSLSLFSTKIHLKLNFYFAIHLPFYALLFTC